MSRRPVECGQCKKDINVIYSEMIENVVITRQMCRNCPVLKEKLQGKSMHSNCSSKKIQLFCNHCHTILESVLMGKPLGCKECYTTFQSFLKKHLIKGQRISPRLKFDDANPNLALHAGTPPYIEDQGNDTTRICELNKALEKALKGEHYEEAAWIRDQINAMIDDD